MSEPFMFTDAPQQPREEPAQKPKAIAPVAAKPIVSTSRRGPPDRAAHFLKVLEAVQSIPANERDPVLRALWELYQE